MKVVVRRGEKRGNCVNMKDFKEWKQKKKEAQALNLNPQGNVYAFPLVVVPEPKVCPKCGEATRENVCPFCGHDFIMG